MKEMKKESWALGIAVLFMCVVLTGCAKLVPSVTGMSQADTLAAIARDGFQATVVMAPSETTPQGTVIFQSPAGGTYLDEKYPVTITVSSGKPIDTSHDPALEGAWNLTQWMLGQQIGPANQLHEFNKGVLTANGQTFTYITVAAATPSQLDLTNANNTTILCSYRFENGKLYISFGSPTERPTAENLDPATGTVWIGTKPEKSVKAGASTGLVDNLLGWVLSSLGL
jgi:hypothetical protein